ncbi:hypothetical protein D3C86_1341730 [compost metagenome]
MKKLILTSFAFTGLTLTAWIIGATSCARNTYNVLIKNLNSYPVRYVEDNVSGFSTREVIQESDTISYHQLGINTQIETHKFLTGINQFHLGNQALAFKPGPPRYNFLEQIRSFHIYTLNDYNAGYRAGDEISAICDFMDQDSRNWLDAAAYNTVLQSMNIAQEYFVPAVFCRVKQGPAVPGTQQQFITELTTTEGVIFRDTTYTFRIY